jgi:copper transport protein
VSRRLIAVEAAAGVALLVAAGVLAQTPPPRVHVSTAAADPVSSSVTVADLVVSVSVSPGRPGLNVFSVVVASSRRPAPTPVDSVALTYSGTGLFLGRTGPEQYLGAAELDGGPIDVTVAVFRGGKRLDAPVRLPIPPAAAASAGSGAAPRLFPYTSAIAVCLLLSGVGIVLITRRRRPLEQAHPHEADAILEEVR